MRDVKVVEEGRISRRLHSILNVISALRPEFQIEILTTSMMLIKLSVAILVDVKFEHKDMHYVIQ